MKPLKRICHIITYALLLLLLVNQTSAQVQFNLPQNIQLKTPGDYEKYEPQIVEAANWLEHTDLDKEVDKRKQVNAFLLQWISGSATVNVSIDEDLQKLFDDNMQLLTIYIAGYARNVIENKTTFTRTGATKAALTAVINVYKKGLGIKKNKGLNKLTKMSDSDLNTYIATDLSSDAHPVITNPH